MADDTLAEPSDQGPRDKGEAGTRGEAAFSTLERMRQLAENIPEPVAYLDIQRRYVFVNQAFLDMRGLRREDVYGRTSAEVLGPETHAQFQPLWDRVIAGEAQSYERMATNVHGEARWIRGRMVPDFDREGKVCGAYVVATDIHDIREAQHLWERQQAELRHLMDSMNSPAASVDADLHYRMVNRAFEEWCGRRNEELRGKHVAEVLGEERWRLIEAHIRRVLEGESVAMERLLTYPDGHERWMSIRYTPRFDETGKCDGYFAVATDIHDQKLIEQQLRRANWMLLTHMENTPLAVMEWDRDARLIRWSTQAEKLFGWRQEDVLGVGLAELGLVYEEDAPALLAALARLKDGAESHATVLLRNHRKDGQLIWCEWYNSRLKDESGQLISMLTLAQDVSARIEAESRLQHLATHDALTGLPNRLLLGERLHQAIANARRVGDHVAILFIDLDGFKNINDSLGHRLGDELLKEVGARLPQTLRQSDFLARLGGDEFMIVLEQLKSSIDAAIVAEKVLAILQGAMRVEGHDLQVSASIGISLFPDDGGSPEELLKNADVAMYRAKELGKNTFQFFSSELAAHRLGEVTLEGALRKAASRGELSLAIRPLRAAGDFRLTGALMEIAWVHPVLGLVPPERFLSLAEHSGFIIRLGDWLLAETLARYRNWSEAGLWVPSIALRISARELCQPRFAENVAMRLAETRCPPEVLCLALAESVQPHDVSVLSSAVASLMARGVRVALDDFGGDGASLGQLRRLPLDGLFLDASLLAGVPAGKSEAALASGVVALGRALGLEVIAKGVQTREQAEFLAQFGCQQIEGDYAGLALNDREFAELLRRERSVGTVRALR